MPEFDEEPTGSYNAVEIMTGHAAFYDDKRPHRALDYLCPVDYYRGDPASRLAERQRKLAVATQRRRQYWTRGRS